MSETPIIVDRRDGYHVITLNRPERLNSFNEAQHLALRAALEDCAADAECRAVLLTGAGRGFCAGQDLSDRDPTMLGESPDLGLTLETFYNPLVRQIRALEKPVICAVNGVAAGAGANIAFACDIVLAAKSAKFIQAFSKIGLIPDAGGTYWLPRKIGFARAMGQALFAEKVTADEAVEMGMIWASVPDDRFAEEWKRRAGQLANGPTLAYGAVKRALRDSMHNSLDRQLALEAELQGTCGGSRDFREGVMAFLEKRPARFEGR